VQLHELLSVSSLYFSQQEKYIPCLEATEYYLHLRDHFAVYTDLLVYLQRYLMYYLLPSTKNRC